MARTTLHCVAINEPKTIAGVDWKLVVATVMFFGMGALMFKAPGVLVLPALLIWLLRGPGRKDPAFLQIHLRHRHQRDHYTPDYVAADNLINLRPAGFNRMEQSI